jgi:hypothetical protein
VKGDIKNVEAYKGLLLLLTTMSTIYLLMQFCCERRMFLIVRYNSSVAYGIKRMSTLSYIHVFAAFMRCIFVSYSLVEKEKNVMAA